ncbi:30817_t:CDS:1, partial [Gigaspora margarita]
SYGEATDYLQGIMFRSCGVATGYLLEDMLRFRDEAIVIDIY